MQRSLSMGLVLVAMTAAIADEKPPQRGASALGPKLVTVGMKMKLDFAKMILEGLAEEDHGKVLEGAKAMRSLNDIETFVRGRSPAYLAQLNVFRTATDALMDGATDKKLDGATLAFTQMTISCVNCHKLLRSDAK